jgi:hypothetical protein
VADGHVCDDKAAGLPQCWEPVCWSSKLPKLPANVDLFVFETDALMHLPALFPTSHT